MANEKRLIDAKAFRKELCDERNYPGRSEEFMIAIDVAIADLVDAPTVDAVEVVRCRDCKRCFKHTTKRNRQHMWICMRNDTDVYVRPDDFCSYGERKDGDGNG